MEAFGSRQENTTGLITLPPSEGKTLEFIMLFRIPLGIIGNALILLAVVFSKRLQTAANAFVVNLALADILTCALLICFYVSNWTWYYFRGLNALCVFTVAMSQACVGCSIYILASISVNRFVIITRSYRMYRLMFRPRIVATWILSIWGISITISVLPPLAFDIGKLGYDVKTRQCNVLYTHERAKLYDSILTACFYPVSLIITIVCYSLIFLHIRHHNRRMKNSNNLNMIEIASTSYVDDRSTDGVSQPPSRPGTISRRQIEITKNLFVIFCAFLLFLMPHAVCSLLGCTGRYTKMIVSLNSVVNPFIYGFSHPLFREVFKSILTCKPISEPSTLGKIYNGII